MICFVGIVLQGYIFCYKRSITPFRFYLIPTMDGFHFGTTTYGKKELFYFSIN